MGLESKSRNNRKDIDNFLKSFIAVLKQKVDTDEYFNFNFPKVNFGQNNQEKTGDTKKYTRPVFQINLVKRGPASISKDSFFIPPHQHSPVFLKKTDTGEVEYIKKDNQIEIEIYTKTKQEQVKIIQLIEEIIEDKQGVLYCDLCQIDNFEIKKNKQKNNLYLLKSVLNFRTIQEVDIILSVGFDSVVIEIPDYVLCTYFDLETGKCLIKEAEKKEEASYDKCTNKIFCNEYEAIKLNNKNKEEDEIWT